MIADLLGTIGLCIMVLNSIAIWRVTADLMETYRTVPVDREVVNIQRGWLYRVIGRFAIGLLIVVLVSWTSRNVLVVTLYGVGVITLWLTISDWWQIRRAGYLHAQRGEDV